MNEGILLSTVFNLCCLIFFFHQSETLVHCGRYSTGYSYLVKLNLKPKKTHIFTILPCHQELNKRFDYTLQVFSPVPVQEFVQLPSPDIAYRKEIRGRWETTEEDQMEDGSKKKGIKTAGGPIHQCEYLYNPMYLLSVKFGKAKVASMILKLSVDYDTHEQSLRYCCPCGFLLNFIL